jgi:hypothetical protein
MQNNRKSTNIGRKTNNNRSIIDKTGITYENKQIKFRQNYHKSGNNFTNKINQEVRKSVKNWRRNNKIGVKIINQ